VLVVPVGAARVFVNHLKNNEEVKGAAESHATQEESIGTPMLSSMNLSN
jgi:hypothetical protein